MQRQLRMPAEWEPHIAMWCTWPDNLQTWPNNLLEAQIEFTALAHTMAQFVHVNVMVNRARLEAAQARLIRPQIKHLSLVDIPSNDAWARDYTPSFVADQRSNELVAIDWEYNAWGGKYPPFDLDQQAGARIAQGHGFERLQPKLFFEGGAIETNGQGLMLSTRSCALDPNRNPEVPEPERLVRFESAFQKFLGIEQTIWLHGDVLPGDDTDGHIDQLARFTDANSIVYAWAEQGTDELLSGLEQNLSDLKQGLDGVAGSFELHPLLLPTPFEHEGRQIPASYCNFVITNDVVLVPQFSVPEDQAAIETLNTLFPEHHVQGLPSRNLSVGLGSFHCLTQQVPDIADR